MLISDTLATRGRKSVDEVKILLLKLPFKSPAKYVRFEAACIIRLYSKMKSCKCFNALEQAARLLRFQLAGSHFSSQRL